jgi:hypothetical protein
VCQLLVLCQFVGSLLFLLLLAYGVLGMVSSSILSTESKVMDTNKLTKDAEGAVRYLFFFLDPDPLDGARDVTSFPHTFFFGRLSKFHQVGLCMQHLLYYLGFSVLLTTTTNIIISSASAATCCCNN